MPASMPEPTGPALPPWRRVLEAHTTWQDWTAALAVTWHDHGVILRGVPPRWGRDVTALDFKIQGTGAMPPARRRLWRLVQYALPRYVVRIEADPDPQVVRLWIKEQE